MIIDALLAYLHYLALFGLFVHLSLEWMLLRRPLVTEDFAKLLRLDLAYFIAALAALLTGLLRAHFGVKGWEFYAANLLFWAKMVLFAAISVLSIIPTLRFIAWVRLAKNGLAPPTTEIEKIRKIILIELVLLTLLPLLAVLMARGISII